MTNAQAERALALDPRVQETLFPEFVRALPEFQQLMEAIARTDNFGSLIVPLVAIAIASRGMQTVELALVLATALQQHPAFLELLKEQEHGA
jgi:hypothetical protein